MTRRTAGWVGWSAWAVMMAVAVVAVVLLVTTGFAWPEAAWGFPGFAAALAVPFGTVGALVVSRRPANTIGWLFVSLGLYSAVQEFVFAYAAMAYQARVPSLPGAAYAAWLVDWITIVPTGGVLVFLFLLFPHGRLPGRRSVPVAVLGALGMVLAFIGAAFRPGALEIFHTVDNPLGLLASRGAADVLADVGWNAFGLAGLLAVIGLGLRWWKAVGAERQQYTWLVAGATAAAAGLTLQDVVPDRSVAELGAIIGFGTVPVAVGIAVLRYRLYEIDRLISRTVSYAVIVVVLGAIYASGVFLLRGLLPLEGDLAVAASTLVVATLFNPLRKQVQTRVDRRFNRSRYDATRTVDGFSVRLRDQIDLDALELELVGVVDRTMQPAGVSLWLRPGPQAGVQPSPMSRWTP